MGTTHKLAAISGSLVLALGLSACGGTAGPTASGSASTSAAATGGTLIVYTNSNGNGRAEYLTEEAKKAGFDIKVVGQGGADTTNKLLAEKNNPVADVVFGLNHMYFESLESAQVLIDYTPKWAGEVDASLGDADASKTYFPLVQQAILLVYNADKLTGDAIPTDWMDLWTKPQLKGRFQSENGLGGATTQLVFAGILDRYKDPAGQLGVSDEGWKQIQGYFENGNKGEVGVDLYARMADGRIDAGQMFSSGIPGFEKTYKIKTGVVKPSVGVPFAVEQISPVKGTKNEARAKAFIDWFGTADVQAAWSAKFGSMPANKTALAKTDPTIVAFHKDIKVQAIDYDFVAKNMATWIEKIELEYVK